LLLMRGFKRRQNNDKITGVLPHSDRQGRMTTKTAEVLTIVLTRFYGSLWLTGGGLGLLKTLMWTEVPIVDEVA